MGWLTTEELVFDADGRLLHPRAVDLQDPLRLRCAGAISGSRCGIGANREDTIYRSKAVGEPPLMLAISVFAAIADAIHSLQPGSAGAARCAGDAGIHLARRAGGDAGLRQPEMSMASGRPSSAS